MLRQTVQYMRQSLQVIWFHIWKTMEELRGETGLDTELGNSALISDEAGTSAYREA